jgi:hypothetical protein
VVTANRPGPVTKCLKSSNPLVLIAKLLQIGATSALGPSTEVTAPKFDFRFTPESGLKTNIAPCPFGAKDRKSLLFRYGRISPPSAQSQLQFEFGTASLSDPCIRANHTCRVTVEPSQSSRDPH